MEEKELLILLSVKETFTIFRGQGYLSDFAMVSLCSLFKVLLVFLKLLLVWETDSINTLERLVLRIPEKIRGRVLSN